VRYIHLPTDEEVLLINSSRQNDNSPEFQRKAAETGSVVLSVFIGGVLVHQTNDPMLAFSFAALLGFLVTRRAISKLKGSAG
jgi:hypothetical protein